MSQHVIRQYAPDADLLGVLKLLTEVEVVDRDGEDVSEASLRDQLTWRNHDPERDCWVVEEPGRSDNLIGYASVSGRTIDQSTLYVAVHPAWRRRGLGEMLHDRVLARARHTGAQRVVAYANVRNEAAHAFLSRHAYQSVSSYRLMRAPADVLLAAVEWPAGFRARSYAEVRHLPTLVKAVDLSYRGMWGHGQYVEGMVSEESVLRWLPQFDPEGIFLVFDRDGDAIAYCQARPEAGRADEHGHATDLLDAPGVVPDYRGRGLQRPLTLLALHWLRSKGRRAITLESWGDDEQTADIYRDIGFVPLQQYTAYRRNVT